MEQHSEIKKGNNELLSIVVIILLVVVGGVFYGVDVYKKSKAVSISETALSPADGPVSPSAN